MPANQLNDFERAYLQRWKTLGPMLDAIRYDELYGMTDQEHLQAVEQLLSLDVHDEPRSTSGLVAWQKLIRR